MLPTRFFVRRRAPLLGLASLPFLVSSVRAEPKHTTHQQVIVPDEDRFQPFALTIHAGDTVGWTN